MLNDSYLNDLLNVLELDQLVHGLELELLLVYLLLLSLDYICILPNQAFEFYL